MKHNLESLSKIVLLLARFCRFVESVRPRETEKHNILVVGHGGLFSVALPRLMENVTYGFSRKNVIETSEMVIAGTARDDKMVCLKWGKYEADEEGSLRVATSSS